MDFCDLVSLIRFGYIFFKRGFGNIYNIYIYKIKKASIHENRAYHK